jgi:hypothetical protein
MSAADLDAVCNAIRERMSNAADRLRDAAAGYGAFADPKQIDL